MGQEDQSRKRYPLDLTDEQWAILEPMIPPAKQSKRGERPREVDMREGCQLRPRARTGLGPQIAPARVHQEAFAWSSA
jgi:transposase